MAVGAQKSSWAGACVADRRAVDGCRRWRRRRASSAACRSRAEARSRHNPRQHFAEAELEELAASIREHGAAAAAPGPARRHRRQLRDRRRRAPLARGAARRLHDVPVVVRALRDQEALEIAIIENVQREDLNAIEEAQGYGC